MSPAPRPNEGTAPTWKSWLVLLSLLTDPKYVAYRLARRWATLRGKAPPHPRAFAPTSDPGSDLSSLDVDLVYLWVSGQDPKHREKRNYWLQQYGLPPKLFNPDVRYVEEDELRYSLRSVEAFVPWARKIFIVTDQQVPSWLNLAHPKIQLVEQSSLMPEESWLPTFNSVAIEAQLHRIPGLAEHFLHVNDDFFFGQPLRKEDFFARLPDGRVVMKVMFSDDYAHYDVWITPAHQVTYSPHGRLWMYSYNNLKVLLESRRPWWKVRYTDFHQAQSMVKSELRKTTEVFPREYRQSSGSRFRNAHDINFMALTRYRCLQEGSAVPGYLSHRFFPHELDLQGYTRETLPALFCINAGLGDESLRQDRILARLFPQPSAFELP
ncbi:MAG: Stealth CR1 domain-containing protein [Bacillota bacterium]|jgi:hypothetical protein